MEIHLTYTEAVHENKDPFLTSCRKRCLRRSWDGAQEAWILSLLCPNADEQAANQILSPEFRGNTESKIKANSSSLYLLHSILPWFALSVTVLSWLKPQ